MTRVTGWGRVCAVAVSVLGLIIVASPSVRAQAVYGSIAGHGHRLDRGRRCPARPSPITSVERRTADTVVTNADGFYVKDRLLPGTLRGEGGAERVQGRGRLDGPRERRHARRRSTSGSSWAT